MMGGRKKRSGFTIVEVMIVLVITSALFLSATALISGRQDETEFDQGIREIQSQIQQTISDVSNGYYPNLSNFQCTAGPGGPVISTGATGQGANTGCIFIGKVMQFGVHSTDPEQFLTYSLAGLQQSGSSNATTLAAAKPVVIAPSSGSPTVPDGSVTGGLQNGITTYSMKANGAAIGAMAFSTVVNAASATTDTLQVNLIAIPGTTLNATEAATAQQINSTMSSIPDTDINPTGGVQLCFVSGTTAQSGLITIGANNSTLTVSLAIKGNKTCS